MSEELRKQRCYRDAACCGHCRFWSAEYQHCYREGREPYPSTMWQTGDPMAVCDLFSAVMCVEAAGTGS